MAVHSLYVLPAGIITIDRSILISGIDIGTQNQVARICGAPHA